MSADNQVLVPHIGSRIQVIRGLLVIIDVDFAALYRVETKRLNEQVKRNRERFPSDYLFQNTAAEKAEVAKRLAALEMKTKSLDLSHDAFGRNTRLQLRQVLDAVRELTTPPDPPKRPIGFITPEDMPKGSKARVATRPTNAPSPAQVLKPPGTDGLGR